MCWEKRPSAVGFWLFARAFPFEPFLATQVFFRRKLHLNQRTSPPSSGQETRDQSQVPVFSIFCLQVSWAQHFTGKVFCQPNGIKILQGTRGGG